MFRTPGVGVVRRYSVDVGDGSLVLLASCLDEADEAEEASVALVSSNPSG